MAEDRPDGFLVLQDALTLQHRKQIIAFSLRERLPNMHVGKEWVEEGGLMSYEDGAIKVPLEPGLGVRLNREKLREYHELYQRLGSYPYDQDPARPGWAPIVPNDRWADPNDNRPVKIPY